MNIITLTTDFGERDYFVGAIKGAIYSRIPQGRIVDISHLIAPFDVIQAAYVLKNAYIHFPKGSIHIIGVVSEQTPERKHLIMKLREHYFIGADNGIFNLLQENEQEEVEIYEVESNQSNLLFPALDFFPDIASEICKGTPLNKIGKATDSYKKTKPFLPEISSDRRAIYGNIIYIDHYGNAVSNITRSLFYQVGENRPFEVIFSMYSFDKIHANFGGKIGEGSNFLLFNSVGYLQIGIFKSNLNTVGGASTLLGIEYADKVSIRFQNKL
ncbi:MAG: SAM-dependent chlorinase/fluorinase [Capnocytophaga sp.]|nr:SAM-dependent chlorinase/fluorinase [Capnocytophaga sp.]